ATSGVSVTVNNVIPDSVPPAISITAPGAGTTVNGASVTISASASDNIGVAGVQFKLDGVNLGSEIITAPYSMSWNTLLASSATHTICAVARDAAGNKTTSSSITVTVKNPADTIAPAVSITSPTAGSTVPGSVTIMASALDNFGVVGVQFKVDGTNVGAEATAPPYSVVWNASAATAGSNHTLTAVARDAAGNRATSAGVAITLSTDTIAPTVIITSPANATTISGATSVNVIAFDNIGIVGVQ